jgi:hypothetical protein
MKNLSTDHITCNDACRKLQLPFFHAKYKTKKKQDICDDLRFLLSMNLFTYSFSFSIQTKKENYTRGKKKNR